MFVQVGFVDPNVYGYTIIFHKLKNLTGSSLFQQILETLLTLRGTDSTIVTLVSIKELYRKLLIYFIRKITICFGLGCAHTSELEGTLLTGRNFINFILINFIIL